MDVDQLSKEQREDIEERVAKAKKVLEDLQLRPTAGVQVVNMGDDVFAQKIVVYLADLKYLSPITKGSDNLTQSITIVTP